MRLTTTNKNKALLWHRMGAYTVRAWEKILSFLFSYPSRCYCKSKHDPSLLVSNPCTTLRSFAKTYGAYSPVESLICRVTKGKEHIELANQLLLEIYQKVHDPLLCDYTACEVLAKVIAYRSLELGDWIPIPVSEGEIRLCNYFVSAKIQLWRGMIAFGLSSEEGPPILLFRGTDITITTDAGRASILVDLDPDGPGHTLFSHAHQLIRSWLEEQSELGRVIGHSLGGVLASYTAIHDPHLLSQKFSSYAFNSPGVHPPVSLLWRKIPPENRPLFKSLIGRGDFVSKFGMLFGPVIELSTPSPLPPILAHEMLYFAQPLCTMTPIDTAKENISVSRNYYTRLQKKTTSLVYRFGLKYLFPNPYR